MALELTVFVFLSCFLAIFVTYGNAESTTTKGPCPENTYFDHGTDYCEPCTDICKNAEYMGTLVQCQRDCPETFKAMQLQDQQQQPAVGMSRAESSPSDSSTAHTTAIIAGCVGGAAGVALTIIVVVFIVKRKQHQQNHKQQQRRQRQMQGQYDASYRLAVQEEDHEQAASERHSHGFHLSQLCDPRTMWSSDERVHVEETTAGREGPHEIALLGSSQSSQGSALGTALYIQQESTRSQPRASASASPRTANSTANTLPKTSTTPVHKPSSARRGSKSSPQTSRKTNIIYKPSASLPVTATHV